MPPELWGFLTSLVAAIPTTVAALAAYRKVSANSDKLEHIHEQVNGNLSEVKMRADYLQHRLSLYESIPAQYRSNIDAGNFESGRGSSGRGDARRSRGEQRRDKDTV